MASKLVVFVFLEGIIVAVASLLFFSYVKNLALRFLAFTVA